MIPNIRPGIYTGATVTFFLAFQFASAARILGDSLEVDTSQAVAVIVSLHFKRSALRLFEKQIFLAVAY